MTRAFNRQIPWVVTLLFAAGAVTTLYLLFGLPNDLALQAGVLSSGEVDRARPFVFRVQLLMVATLAAGFAGLLILSRRTRVQEVYVERMRQQEKQEEANRQAAKDEKKQEALIEDLLTKETNPDELYKQVFDRLCQKTEAVAGAFYQRRKNEFTLTHHYALALGESQKFSYEAGEGLVGQAGKSGKKMVVNDVPENSMRVVSGLGESTPRHLVIIPLTVDGKTIAVSEIGTFQAPEEHTVRSLEEAHRRLGDFLSGGTTTARTKKKSTAGKS